MPYHWRWEVFLEPAPAGGTTYLGWMLAGLRMTVGLSLASWLLAFGLGSVMGVLRTVPNRLLSALAAAYVEVFRNVPLLVQLFLWYFVAPELVPIRAGTWFKQLAPNTQLFLSAMLCLAFFTGARICEQVRAGIQSLARGQRVDYTAQPYESFIAVTALYLGVNALILLLMRGVERRSRLKGTLGAGG